MWGVFYWVCSTFVNYLIITTVVDILLMGRLHIRYSRRCAQRHFMMEGQNRIDFQTKYECSAFASAYLLRHHGREADGNVLYEKKKKKTREGYVYPKGIVQMLSRYGIRVKYCAGNFKALKREICKGAPVIVMLRTRVGERYLHFVPVVGYDEENVYLAESIKEFANCGEGEEVYNRKVGNAEFMKLWNTSMLKMPFYRNTYFEGGSRQEPGEEAGVRQSAV